MISTCNKFIAEIENLLKPYNSSHYLHEPFLDKETIKDLNECVQSSYVSTYGDYLDKFKNNLSKKIGTDNIVLTNSGTSSLHLALCVIEIKDKEVLLPSMTFVATTNSIIYNNGIPHFIDVGENDINIDPIKLENYLENISIIKNNKCYNKKTKKQIKCLITLHAFGYPAKINIIKNICKKFFIELVEDAAGALGSTYQKKHVGTFGRFGIISFNGNKIITTGMGGAIICKNKKDYQLVKELSSTARIKHLWKIQHNRIAYNYRMTNINAALGLSQLKNLNKFIKNKKKLHMAYANIIKSYNELEIFKNIDGTSNYWLNNLIINSEFKKYKVDLIQKMHKKNIFVRELWTPQHLLKMYKKYPKSNLKNTLDIWERTISLPSSNYNEI